MEPVRSIFQWFDDQGWSDELKAEAKEEHEERMAKGLNPYTLGQWNKWAEARSGYVTG